MVHDSSEGSVGKRLYTIISERKFKRHHLFLLMLIFFFFSTKFAYTYTHIICTPTTTLTTTARRLFECQNIQNKQNGKYKNGIDTAECLYVQSSERKNELRECKNNSP